MSDSTQTLAHHISLSVSVDIIDVTAAKANEKAISFIA